jgi:hypothetical protein
MKTLSKIVFIALVILFSENLNAQMINGIGLSGNIQMLDSPDAVVFIPELNFTKKLGKKLAFVADANYSKTVPNQYAVMPKPTFRKRLTTQVGLALHILPSKNKFQMYIAPKYTMLHRNEQLYAGFSETQTGPTYYYTNRAGWLHGAMVAVGAAHKTGIKGYLKAEARLYDFELDNTLGLNIGWIFEL